VKCHAAGVPFASYSRNSAPGSRCWQLLLAVCVACLWYSAMLMCVAVKQEAFHLMVEAAFQDEVKVLFCPALADFGKSIAFWKVPTFRPFVRLVGAACMKMSMAHWRNGTGRGNRSAGRKPCRRATLSTAGLTWTGPRSNPSLRGERPATNRLSY
jgi:hypothetical protein